MAGWRSTCVSWQSLRNNTQFVYAVFVIKENIASGNYYVLCYSPDRMGGFYVAGSDRSVKVRKFYSKFYFSAN